MGRISQRDIHSLNECIRKIHTHHDIDTYPLFLLEALKKVVAADFSMYTEVNLNTFVSRPVFDLPDIYFPEGDLLFATYSHEHPVFYHEMTTGDGQALKISDFLTRRQYKMLGLYNELLGKVDVEYQIAISFPPYADHLLGVVLNRKSKDFSERDRDCLNLLSPHVLQSLHTVRLIYRLQHEASLLGKELAALHRGILRIKDGRVQEVPEYIWHWFQEFFDTPRWRTDSLPETLSQWLATQQVRVTEFNGDPQAVCEPLHITSGSERLEIRFILDASGGDYLLIEKQRLEYAPDDLREPLGLTKRQSEVLFWITQGKTDRDVATILGITPRTVNKHVEKILPKLGVDNRLAAANLARDVLGF